MALNKRTKELYIDILVKILQIVFAALVIGSFVSGGFDLTRFASGVIASLLCLGVATRIAFSLQDEQEVLTYMDQLTLVFIGVIIFALVIFIIFTLSERSEKLKHAQNGLELL